VRRGIEILTNMFNKIKNGKEFPRDWKIAIIHPIYKGKGNWDNLVTIEEFRFYQYAARYFQESWLVG
jgi:hypothetical protein